MTFPAHRCFRVGGRIWWTHSSEVPDALLREKHAGAEGMDWGVLDVTVVEHIVCRIEVFNQGLMARTAEEGERSNLKVRGEAGLAYVG